MSRACTICKSPFRNDIETALRNGEAYSDIAKQYGTSKAALSRHKPHMVQDLAEVVSIEEKKEKALAQTEGQRAARAAKQARSAAEELLTLKELAQEQMDAAKAAKDIKAFAFWFKELRDTLELFFKIGLAMQKPPEESGVSSELESMIAEVVGDAPASTDPVTLPSDVVVELVDEIAEGADPQD